MPCAAFLDGIGKLYPHRTRLAVQRGNGVVRAALRDDIARATFALTALRRDAKFELHLVKAHPRTGVARDFAIRDAAADADNHGDEEAVAGCKKLF